MPEAKQAFGIEGKSCKEKKCDWYNNGICNWQLVKVINTTICDLPEDEAEQYKTMKPRDNIS